MSVEPPTHKAVLAAAERLARALWPDNEDAWETTVSSESRWLQGLPASLGACTPQFNEQLAEGVGIFWANAFRSSRHARIWGLSETDYVSLTFMRSPAALRYMPMEAYDAIQDLVDDLCHARFEAVLHEYNCQRNFRLSPSLLIAPLQAAQRPGFGWIAPFDALPAQASDATRDAWTAVNKLTGLDRSVRTHLASYTGRVCEVLSSRYEIDRNEQVAQDGIQVVLAVLGRPSSLAACFEYQLANQAQPHRASIVRSLAGAWALPAYARGRDRLDASDLTRIIHARHDLLNFAWLRAGLLNAHRSEFLQVAVPTLDEFVDKLIADRWENPGARALAERLATSWIANRFDLQTVEQLERGLDPKVLTGRPPAIAMKKVATKSSASGVAAKHASAKQAVNPVKAVAKKPAQKPAPIPHPEQPADSPKAAPVPIGLPAEAQAAYDEILGLEGVTAFKNFVKQLVSTHHLNQRLAAEDLPPRPFLKHLVFVGNPGSGKTTAARLLARLLHALGALDKDTCRETSRQHLVGMHRGETAHKTAEEIRGAVGGVLLIDEAYTLIERTPGESSEAINTLVSEMDNRRDEMVIIAAGYPDEMQRFLSTNPGLKDRFGSVIKFEDMSNAALASVVFKVLEGHKLRVPEHVGLEIHTAVQGMIRGRNFANARAARNLAEAIVSEQVLRVADRHDVSIQEVAVNDVHLAVSSGRVAAAGRPRRDFEEILSELDGLIGLTELKGRLRSIVDIARVDKMRRDRGLPGASELGHFLFTGNPGTGKTTIARLLGELFAAIDLLPSGHTTEVGRAELVGHYLGQTAPKVKEAFDAAHGGVLFIDEAYSLTNHGHNKDVYAAEAVATIVQEMENRRSQVIVVMAGYTKEMTEFLDSNTGLRGRLSHKLEFPDYGIDELVSILERKLESDKFDATEEFFASARQRLQVASSKPAFANARAVRELVSAAKLAQATRVMGIAGTVDDTTLLTLNGSDVPDWDTVGDRFIQPIGFV